MIAPLVPTNVDLRDFGFMPLDVLRLRDSDLTALSSGEEFKAAVMLWCVAWHQVPAASLPDDDRLLARFSGTGAAWKKLREGALRGFVKCSDGRLYHRTIAEKALESWAAKQRQRERTAAATAAREAKRRAALGLTDDQRDEQRDVERNDSRDVGRNDQRDVKRDVVQGTGTVKGQGQGIEKDGGPPLALVPPDGGPPQPKACRIPDEFPDEKALLWAKNERPDLDAETVAAMFRDHWSAKPGKDGRKLDWQGTWRNWVRAQRALPARRAVQAAVTKWD
jgi:hypothetical protein